MMRSNITNKTMQQLLFVLVLLSITTLTTSESTSTSTTVRSSSVSTVRRVISSLSSLSSSSLRSRTTGSRLLADTPADNGTTPVEQPQKHIVLHAKAPDDKKTIFYEYLPDTYDFLLRYNSQPTDSNTDNFEASLSNMVALVKKNKADPTIYVIPCPQYDMSRVYCYDGYGHYNFTLDTWEIEVSEDVTEPTDPTFLYTRIDGNVHVVNDPNDTFFDDIDTNLSTDIIHNITIDSNITSAPVDTIPLSGIITNSAPNTTTNDTLSNSDSTIPADAGADADTDVNDQAEVPNEVVVQQQESESKTSMSKSTKNITITFTVVGTVLTILFIILYMKKRRNHSARYRRQVLDDLHTTTTNKEDTLVGYITSPTTTTNTSSSFSSSFSTIGMNNFSKNNSKYTDTDTDTNSTSTSDQLSHSMNNRGTYYSNNAKRFSDEPTEIDAADLRDVELH